MKRMSVLLVLCGLVLPLRAGAFEISSALPVPVPALSGAAAVPVEKGMAPGEGPLLVNQPASIVNPSAYASHDLSPPLNDQFDLFIADDFTASTDWLVGRIFVPGETTTIADLSCADSLNWQIYGDGGGVPDGDPRGNGNPPVWSLSLPPGDPQVSFSAGSLLGNLSNVYLQLKKPFNLPAGHYWLSFFVESTVPPCGQWFWRPSDATNGAVAKVINPDGGFGFPGIWANVTDPGTWGLSQQDFAFLIEGAAQPAFGLDIKANFEDGPVTTPAGGRNIITVSLEPKGAAGTPAEYWVAAVTPFGLFSYSVGRGWGPGVDVSYTGVLGSLPPFIVYDGKIPKGSYVIYFIVDLLLNGELDIGGGNGFLDKAKIVVQ